MKKSLVIDMRDLKIKGDILDISQPGNTIISQFVSTQLVEENPLEKDFISYKAGKQYDEKDKYDLALAFFSLNVISSRRRLKNLLESIGNALRCGGKLIIWDYHREGYGIFVNLRVRALMAKGTNGIFELRIHNAPLKPGFYQVISILEKIGLSILTSRVSGNTYYIEAVKGDKKKNDEDNSCSAQC